MHHDPISPIKTEKKNCVIGTSKIGDDMFRNQLGDIGNNLKNNRKKNRLSRFSLTYETRQYMYMVVSAKNCEN